MRLERLEAASNDPALLDRLKRQVEREAERLIEYVHRAVSEPICAIAFLYTDEHRELAFSYTYAWPARDREALEVELARSADPVWRPADWAIDLDLASPSSQALAEAKGLGEALLKDSSQRDVGDAVLRDGPPAEPFLLDLSAHLNSLDWSSITSVTDYFVIWANEHELGSLTRTTFESIAPPAAVAAYERRGWLSWLDEHSWSDE